MTYYQDKLVTIYHDSFQETSSDVIVLAPPAPLLTAYIFKAKVYYIFCGNKVEFYSSQFPNGKRVGLIWYRKLDDFANPLSDVVLVIGDIRVPNISVYHRPHFSEWYHDWELPLELLFDLLSESKGDILDPFMGSGTTLVAAKMLGRKAVGYDTNERCCEIAAERCREI